MKKYTQIKQISRHQYNVFLKVGNQSFCVTPYAFETKVDAEWFQEMFVKALEKIITKECKCKK